ncbi:MAG: DUF5050 domain-containing protein [Chloroflexi bacterium]|nr:DUF5050 domain-containing protein [Chloroflexota bacterium]
MDDIRKAIDYIKAGEKGEARRILANILKTDPDNEQAWLYMASCARTKEEYRQSIQRVLKINPNNQTALKLAARDNINFPDDKPFVDPDATRLSESTEEIAPNVVYRPALRPQPKRRGAGRLFVYLVLFLLIVGGGLAAVVFFTADDNPDPARQTQAAEIEGTNSAFETDVAAQATSIQNTFAAQPTTPPTVNSTAISRGTELAQETATIQAETTEMLTTPTVGAVEAQNGGLIAVQRVVGEDGSVDPEIVVYRDPEDDDFENLTNTPGDDVMPDWSPDGSQIAFVSYRDGNAEVYVMDSDGENITRLTTSETAKESYPAWSPDGSQIAYASDSDGDFEIYVINTDGSGEPVQITDNAANDSYPAWSSDNRIAFASNRDGNFEIYRMDSDGGNLQRLTEHEGDDFNPSWSPDSQQIIFINQTPEARDIFKINADGTQLVNLTESDINEFSPSWTPDGSTIIYAVEQESGFVIYTMDADGSNQAEFKSANTSLDSPDWGVAQ